MPIAEGDTSGNMSEVVIDQELDDFVLVKKWRDFQNNRKFQKNEKNGEGRSKKSFAMIVTSLVIKETECPNKKKNIKKKVFQATWDDSEDEKANKSQEKIANMYFMRIDDNVKSIEQCSYDDLSSSYNEIFEDFEKVALNHPTLKKSSNC